MRRAQQPAKVVQIGFLHFGPASARASRVEALQGGLRDLGYVEGENFVFRFRWVESVEQLPELPAQLVRMNVDVILATSSTMVEPARRATKTIPIVCVRSSCRPCRRRARCEPRVARRKYHWDVDAAHRARRQGIWKF